MRVMVLGAGYAGLVAAATIERNLPDAAELVVVDETGTHLIQHELHRVVRRPDLADHLTVPVEDVVPDATVITDRVEDLRPAADTVSLAEGGELEYEACAICLGAQTADQEHEGVAEYGQPLKRIPHANAIRERFDSLVDDGGGEIVVGGAGLSGIQVAGELAALTDRRGLWDQIDISLFEMADEVAPGFPDRLQEALSRQLRTAGVDLRLGTAITDATEESVHTAAGEEIRTGQFIWTGGIRGPTALAGERLQVRADLALNDRTFIAGDAARIIDGDGQPVPATAQAAVEAGEVCGRNLLHAAGAGPDRPARFTFESLGWLVSVGDRAVAQVGPSVFTGRPARTLKASAGLRYLAELGAVREALEVVTAELYG
jgi:NADH dehydrogenase